MRLGIPSFLSEVQTLNTATPWPLDATGVPHTYPVTGRDGGTVTTLGQNKEHRHTVSTETKLG